MVSHTIEPPIVHYGKPASIEKSDIIWSIGSWPSSLRMTCMCHTSQAIRRDADPIFSRNGVPEEGTFNIALSHISCKECACSETLTWQRSSGINPEIRMYCPRWNTLASILDVRTRNTSKLGSKPRPKSKPRSAHQNQKTKFKTQTRDPRQQVIEHLEQAFLGSAPFLPSSIFPF